MKTIEIKIYKFNELSEEAKKVAIETVREFLFEEFWDSVEYLFDTAIEELEKAGIQINREDISTSLGRDAHAGVSAKAFKQAILREYGDYISDIVILPKKIGVWFSEFPTMSWRGTDVDAISEWYFYNDVSIEKEAEIRKEVEDKLLKVVEIMEKLFKWLRDEEEALYSDEWVEEVIKANEYEFYESGEIY